MAGMAVLSAGLALALLAQAFRRWFLEAVAGGRFAAVARVLGKLLFQVSDPSGASMVNSTRTTVSLPAS